MVFEGLRLNNDKWSIKYVVMDGCRGGWCRSRPKLSVLLSKGLSNCGLWTTVGPDPEICAGRLEDQDLTVHLTLSPPPSHIQIYLISLNRGVHYTMSNSSDEKIKC